MPRLRPPSAANRAAIVLALLLAAPPAAAQGDVATDSVTDSNRCGYVVLAAAGAYVVASMPVMERIWYRDRIREYGGVRGFGAILRSQR